MALFVLGSVRGAPGATSGAVSLAIAWRRATGRDVLLVEADPDGGVLAARHGVSCTPSLTELSGAARLGLDGEHVWHFAQRLPGTGVPAVVAHPAAEQTQAAMRTAAPHLGRALAALPGHDVLADIGRIRPGSPSLPLAERATAVVVFLRPTVEDAVALAHRALLLRSMGEVRAVLTDAGPYGATEIARSTAIPVAGHLRPEPARRRRRARWATEVTALVSALRGAADSDADAGAEAGAEPPVGARGGEVSA
jgi:hypothetical protein